MKEQHSDPLEVNPCKEIELAWRHEKVEYIFRLIKDLNNKEFIELMRKLEE